MTNKTDFSTNPSPDGLATTTASVEPAAPLPAPLQTVLNALDGVPGVLETWLGQRLVSMRWKDRTNADVSGGVDISLTEVKRPRGSASFALTFSCKPLKGDAVAIRVRVNPYTKNNAELHLRLVVLEGTYRDWVCVSNDEDHAEGWRIANRLAKPKGLPALDALADLWFSEGDAADKRSAVAPRVERGANTSIDPRLKPWWPRCTGTAREWTLGRTPGDGFADRAVDTNEWAAALCAYALWSVFLQSLLVATEGDEIDRLVRPDVGGFPAPELYVSRRAVDLNAGVVQERLDKEGLRIPWHVVEAACAALNSGKHVIFTGPPGCGKSKLAGILAHLGTGRDPQLVTASPAWTSGDLVGRYFPTRQGSGLEFRPGFFLQAIDSGNRWLIIDEFNRANIDECFGELFSALANDVVHLPFDEEIENSAAENGVARYGRVRIVPEGVRSGGDTAGEMQTVDYPVGASFRMIGTMNDADRAALHKLSFALLRRFQIIRVEAPSPRTVRQIIDGEITKVTSDLKLHELAYLVDPRGGKKKRRLDVDSIKELLYRLFANERDTKRKGKSSSTRGMSQADSVAYSDLVRERVVGLATVLDVIRFVAEGIRAPNDDTIVQVLEKEGPELDEQGRSSKAADHAHETSASFLALGIALSVFPQLDGLTTQDRLRAVRHIVRAFETERLLMRRIEENDDSAPAPSQPESAKKVAKDGARSELKLTYVEQADPGDFDADNDGYVSLGEFLVEELCQQYRGTPEVAEYRAILESLARSEAAD